MTKIIVIGANHAGTACVNTILDNFPGTEVVVYDRNNNISFLGCGMALWIGGQISGSEGLFYCSKDILESKGAKINMESEVLSLDENKKEIEVRLANGDIIKDNYDKLILATGSRARCSDVPGENLDNIKVAKLFQDAKAVKELMDDESIKDTVVIGSGYIGVELVEAFARIGKNVTLVTRSPRILRGNFDEDIAKPIADLLTENGVKIRTNENLVRYEGKDRVEKVVTDKGEYPADLVINSIGFEPNAFLGDSLQRHCSGAYEVNKKFETSNKDIYAIGDCATNYNNATGKTDYIALATNAVRSGIVAAVNACGGDLESAGVQGSSGMSIYDYKVVMTGLTTDQAAKEGIEVKENVIEDLQMPEFMEVPNEKVRLKVIYRADNRKIVGAQMGSLHDMSMGIHLFSLAIERGVTIDELALTDVFFMPHFNKPYNYITMAALTAK